MRRLLDADVLIGALDGDDAHHGRARELFTQWRENKDVCAVSVVNLTEVLTAPSADVARLAAAREAIAALGVTVNQPNEQPPRRLLPRDRQAHGLGRGVLRREDPQSSRTRTDRRRLRRR
jgi:predicted nucleic acid-binding protein